MKSNKLNLLYKSAKQLVLPVVVVGLTYLVSSCGNPNAYEVNGASVKKLLFNSDSTSVQVTYNLASDDDLHFVEVNDKTGFHTKKFVDLKNASGEYKFVDFEIPYRNLGQTN